MRNSVLLSRVSFIFEARFFLSRVLAQKHEIHLRQREAKGDLRLKIMEHVKLTHPEDWQDCLQLNTEKCRADMPTTEEIEHNETDKRWLRKQLRDHHIPFGPSASAEELLPALKAHTCVNPHS